MTQFSTGDLEKIVGVKSYVIRYWEKELPMIQSERDANGRRLYSTRDVELFLRFKHLVHDRRFTIEGAREELLRESSGDLQESAAALSALRSSLIDIYFLNKHT